MAASSDDVRTEVLNRVLSQVAGNKASEEPEEAGNALSICVVCLEHVSEESVARPCGHDNFDFLCLLSWLERASVCPLCKAKVDHVEYNDQEGLRKQYIVPKTAGGHKPSATTSSTPSRSLTRPRARGRQRPWRGTAPVSPDAALLRRRQVYSQRLYSLHVGTNRISAYSELSPSSFNTGPSLVARAKSWIRRELQVFSYLNSSNSANTDDASSQQNSSSTFPSVSSSSEPTLRSASNAEFLLEYIIAILKTIDIKSSTGQAEDMVAEFLGRENARLFLHELSSWLRSPYESVDAWDRHVQYPEPVIQDGSRESSRRRENPRKRELGHPNEDLHQHHSTSTTRGGRRGGMRRGPKRRMLDRYVPD